MSDNRRPETGPMEFPGDWPGVFIRGDEAFFLAMQLKTILNPTENESPLVAHIAKSSVAGLITLLLSCDVRTKPTPTKAVLEPLVN